jgi:hypothetical protein
MISQSTNETRRNLSHARHRLTVEHAPVFEPLLVPARYKAAWGGRGSGLMTTRAWLTFS